jgi:hypothetical protein
VILGDLDMTNESTSISSMSSPVVSCVVIGDVSLVTPLKHEENLRSRFSSAKVKFGGLYHFDDQHVMMLPTVAHRVLLSSGFACPCAHHSRDGHPINRSK